MSIASQIWGKTQIWLELRLPPGLWGFGSWFCSWHSQEQLSKQLVMGWPEAEGVGTTPSIQEMLIIVIIMMIAINSDMTMGLSGELKAALISFLCQLHFSWVLGHISEWMEQGIFGVPASVLRYRACYVSPVHLSFETSSYILHVSFLLSQAEVWYLFPYSGAIFCFHYNWETPSHEIKTIF